VDTQLDLGLDLQFPRKYVESGKHRLELYRRMARIRDDAQAAALERELADRFGKAPREVSLMLTAALTRNRLARLGILSVTRGEGHLKLRALSASKAHRSLSLVSQSFRVLDESNLALPLRKGIEQPADQLRFLSNLMSALAAKKGFGDDKASTP
jgi:transcription-repair coupling factor (superfamily II helicase)